MDLRLSMREVAEGVVEHGVAREPTAPDGPLRERLYRDWSQVDNDVTFSGERDPRVCA